MLVTPIDKMSKYDVERLKRFDNLNNFQKKQLIIAIGLHQRDYIATMLGYSAPYMGYKWIDWSKNNIPIIYQLFTSKIDLRPNEEELNKYFYEAEAEIAEIKGQQKLFEY